MAQPTDPKKRENDFFRDARATVPSPLELDSNTAWAEFERLRDEFASGKISVGSSPRPKPNGAPSNFEPTQQTGAHAAPRTAPGGSPAARSQAPLTAAEVMVEARRYNRVCPKPEAWLKLYEMLPNKVTHPRPQPAPPITGAAWAATSPMPKRMCLRDHIEWAEKQGALPQVMQFLQALPEDQWHHMSE